MAGLKSYFEDVLGLPLNQVSYIDVDVVTGRLDDDGTYDLAWGDAVHDVSFAHGVTTFRVAGGAFRNARVRVKGPLALRDTPLFRLSMIDVQQGDGMVIETPGNQLVLVDGGDNQLFARHLAARFGGTTADKPLEVDAIIVTHGDADHFDGLSEIVRSETLRNTAAEPTRTRKRLFLHPARVLHNGLVKSPGKVDGVELADKDMLGPIVEHDGRMWATQLVDAPAEVEPKRMNAPFVKWQSTLDHWDARRAGLGLPAIDIRRVGTDVPGALDFLAGEPGLGVDLFGPQVTRVDGAPAMPLLRRPESDPNLHLPSHAPRYGGYSASHTINGHSIAFRLHCGNVRFMLTGDLNRESMEFIRRNQVDKLPAEVLKVPHHGSHDFDMAFVRAVGPVVSLVSSGDENAAKEYIHPRATLLAALGRAGRSDVGVVFITELSAFFRTRGYATETRPGTAEDRKEFFAFERTNFGIVHLRTDGQKVLALTHSGKQGMNEAYGFTVSANGDVVFRELSKASAAPKSG